MNTEPNKNIIDLPDLSSEEILQDYEDYWNDYENLGIGLPPDNEKGDTEPNKNNIDLPDLSSEEFLEDYEDYWDAYENLGIGLPPESEKGDENE